MPSQPGGTRVIPRLRLPPAASLPHPSSAPSLLTHSSGFRRPHEHALYLNRLADMASGTSPHHDLAVPSLARLSIHDEFLADTGYDRLPSRGMRSSVPNDMRSPPPSSLTRARSPFARGHSRSQSAHSLSAPPMARTKSLPSVTSWTSSLSPSPSSARSSSPLRPSSSSSRVSPRRSFEDARPLIGASGVIEIESIAEDSEVDFSPRTLAPPTSAPGPTAANSASFQRSNSGRRRPTSPLRQHAAFADTGPTSSPQPPVARFNESFPSASPSVSSYGVSGGSSVVSTPTSVRSRSPSSSLHTIEDSPDAEEEEAELYALANLKAAADAVEAAEFAAQTEAKLRAAGVEAPAPPPPPATIGGSATWSPQSLKEKRKRWSVCGAERRGDFEMETIWED